MHVISIRNRDGELTKIRPLIWTASRDRRLDSICTAYVHWAVCLRR